MNSQLVSLAALVHQSPPEPRVLYHPKEEYGDVAIGLPRASREREAALLRAESRITTASHPNPIPISLPAARRCVSSGLAPKALLLARSALAANSGSPIVSLPIAWQERGQAHSGSSP